MSSDQSDVLAAIRRIKTESTVKPMASAIAHRLGWVPVVHGSSKRLNDALQALRTAGAVHYVKGVGWTEIDKPAE